MKVILLDIEGTTTPIDFVHKTLFPFSRSKLDKFVREHWGEMANEIIELAAEAAADSSFIGQFDPTVPNSVIEYLEHLIDLDRKSRPLKTIQGRIWQLGYESGELCSVVFDDVPKAFRRWSSQGKSIAIYSSGSVLAQKLLFRYTRHGDLTTWITSYFDTTVGHKRDADSYRKIAAELDIETENITFVSDIAEELAAAKEAGMGYALSLRPGNAAVTTPERRNPISSLDELAI